MSWFGSALVSELDGRCQADECYQNTFSSAAGVDINKDKQVSDHVSGYYDVVFPTTVNSLLATTFRKRPPLVSDHFVNDRYTCDHPFPLI